MAHLEKFLSVKEVAVMMHVSVATIWRYAQRGTLPEPIRIDGHTWWIEAEVLAVVEKKKAARHKPINEKKRFRVQLEEA